MINSQRRPTRIVRQSIHLLISPLVLALGVPLVLLDWAGYVTRRADPRFTAGQSDDEIWVEGPILRTSGGLTRLNDVTRLEPSLVA